MSHKSLLAAVRAEMSARLTVALRARDAMSMRALRAALGALDNATAVPLAGAGPVPYGVLAEVARHEPTRADIEASLVSEADERAAAAAEYERLGHADRAGSLRREAAIIRATLAHVAAADAEDAP